MFKNGKFDRRLLQRLDDNLQADMVVIGGGISGALTAWELTHAGVDTVLIDSRPFGAGSTSASTALIQYEIDTPLWKLAAARGLKSALRSYRLCRLAISQLQQLTDTIGDRCSFEFIPSLQYASSPRHRAAIEREYRLRKDHGFDVALLESAEIDHTFGFQSPCGILSESGAQFDPLHFTYKLLEHACAHGLRLFSPVDVAGVSQHGKESRVHLAGGAEIKARSIVCATGYDTRRFIKKKFCTLKSTFAFASAPLPRDMKLWHRRCMIWETARPYLYMRTTQSHSGAHHRRVVVGGEDEPFRNERLRDKTIRKKIGTLKQKFIALFPKLKIEPEYTWAGTFAETKDGLPFIGRAPGIPNVFFCLGYGGNGITYSVIASRIIRDQFLQRSNRDAELFSFDR